MAVIETKYSVGDTVFSASTTTERKQHPCPDCLGEHKWKAISPAGTEYTFGCPRCAARYQSFNNMSLAYTASVPSVSKLTIGSVQFNSASGSWDSGARYMCAEMGIGSGNVYDEAKLFPTEDEALRAATLMANKANAETEWIVKLYDQSLEISDYQLESAALKLAKDEASRIGSLMWNLSDLFVKISEADDKDAIIEAVDDYKSYDWSRDKAKLLDEMRAELSEQVPA